MRAAASCSVLLTWGIAIIMASSAAKADYCASLQAELASLNQAARSPAVLQRQLQDAQNQASQDGCFGGGFFSFFQPSPGGRCATALARVNRLQAMLWSSGSGGMSFGFTYDLQRRQSEIRRALARSGCGSAGGAGDYRTLCVRTCDGYYFPISYATTQSRFKTDAAVCQSMYPPGQADLYVHRTTGEDATQAVSLAGASYAKQTFAFVYRSTYDHACASLFSSGSGARVLCEQVARPAQGGGSFPGPPLTASARQVPKGLHPGHCRDAGEPRSPPTHR